MPDGLLMLWNSFINFIFEHWSGCCATEPGYTGDIGTIKILLIDWLTNEESRAEQLPAPLVVWQKSFATESDYDVDIGAKAETITRVTVNGLVISSNQLKICCLINWHT